MKTIALKETLRKLSVLGVCLPLLFASCEGEDTPPPPGPDDPTNSEISISNNGLKTKAAAEDATELTFTINLAKKQGNPTVATTVTLEYSAEALAAYKAANAEAADFEAIPEAAATFATSVVIAKDATTNTADVEFDMAQLLSLITPGEDLKYVYPVKIAGATGDNVKIDTAKDYILIGVTVDEAIPTGPWTFTVKILLDKYSYDNTYFGQDDIIKERLGLIFDEVNNIWNGVNRGEPYFANEIKYVPYFEGSECVYDGRSDRIFDKPTEAIKWRGDCNVICIMDCVAGDIVGERDGAGYGEQGNRILIAKYSRNLLLDPSDDMWTAQTLAHELGHFRGVPDVYSMGISASLNLINGVGFEGYDIGTCVMNGCYDGLYIWSDYAVYIINANANIVERKDQPIVLDNLYPENMNIVVKRGGAAVPNAEVNIYSQGQYASTPISTTPRISGTTNDSGISRFSGNVMFSPSRAGLLIIEVIDPTNNANKGYRFVPQYETSVAYFQGLTDWDLEIDL